MNACNCIHVSPLAAPSRSRITAFGVAQLAIPRPHFRNDPREFVVDRTAAAAADAWAMTD